MKGGLTQMLNALKGLLRTERKDDGLLRDLHRAELEEFFTVRDMTCMACDYTWTALVPIEFEVIFEANLECPTCELPLGVIDDKRNPRKIDGRKSGGPHG